MENNGARETFSAKILPGENGNKIVTFIILREIKILDGGFEQNITFTQELRRETDSQTAEAIMENFRDAKMGIISGVTIFP